MAYKVDPYTFEEEIIPEPEVSVAPPAVAGEVVGVAPTTGEVLVETKEGELVWGAGAPGQIERVVEEIGEAQRLGEEYVPEMVVAPAVERAQEAQFEELVKSGEIEKGSEFVPLEKGWGYIPGKAVKEYGEAVEAQKLLGREARAAFEARSIKIGDEYYDKAWWGGLTPTQQKEFRATGKYTVLPGEADWMEGRMVRRAPGELPPGIVPPVISPTAIVPKGVDSFLQETKPTWGQLVALGREKEYKGPIVGPPPPVKAFVSVDPYTFGEELAIPGAVGAGITYSALEPLGVTKEEYGLGKAYNILEKYSTKGALTSIGIKMALDEGVTPAQLAKLGITKEIIEESKKPPPLHTYLSEFETIIPMPPILKKHRGALTIPEEKAHRIAEEKWLGEAEKLYTDLYGKSEYLWAGARGIPRHLMLPAVSTMVEPRGGFKKVSGGEWVETGIGVALWTMPGWGPPAARGLAFVGRKAGAPIIRVARPVFRTVAKAPKWLVAEEPVFGPGALRGLTRVPAPRLKGMGISKIETVPGWYTGRAPVLERGLRLPGPRETKIFGPFYGRTFPELGLGIQPKGIIPRGFPGEPGYGIRTTIGPMYTPRQVWAWEAFKKGEMITPRAIVDVEAQLKGVRTLGEAMDLHAKYSTFPYTPETAEMLYGIEGWIGRYQAEAAKKIISIPKTLRTKEEFELAASRLEALKVKPKTPSLTKEIESLKKKVDRYVGREVAKGKGEAATEKREQIRRYFKEKGPTPGFRPPRPKVEPVEVPKKKVMVATRERIDWAKYGEAPKVEPYEVLEEAPAIGRPLEVPRISRLAPLLPPIIAPRIIPVITPVRYPMPSPGIYPIEAPVPGKVPSIKAPPRPGFVPPPLPVPRITPIPVPVFHPVPAPIPEPIPEPVFEPKPLPEPKPAPVKAPVSEYVGELPIIPIIPIIPPAWPGVGRIGGFAFGRRGVLRRGPVGAWRFRGYPVRGIHPLTGEVVGEAVWAGREKRYGAVPYRPKPKPKKTGIKGSRIDGGATGSGGRAYVPATGGF